MREEKRGGKERRKVERKDGGKERRKGRQTDVKLINVSVIPDIVLLKCLLASRQKNHPDCSHFVKPQLNPHCHTAPSNSLPRSKINGTLEAITERN